MSGPDLVNSLLGVLLRFRKEAVAVTADIEQMFYQFYVTEEHRDYLRFFWYKDNNPECPMIEYRMSVHVFGNSPSPTVATYGLRKTVEKCEHLYGPEVQDFVNKNFYVDDGLTFLPTSEQAIDLMSRTQTALKTEGNIRLHKITSNSQEVMDAFALEDLSKGLRCVQIGKDSLLVQHSLGLLWDLTTDSFVFDILQDDKPYTRRGLLSSVNSIYDPLGFLAPVTISGKILLRDASPPGTDWDEPLSQLDQARWEEWRESLQSLKTLRIPRMYVPLSLSLANNVELHIFSDASEKAIAAVAYLKTVLYNGDSHVGFILGKSKLAPQGGHTKPRLELCAAVLATEIGELVLEHMDLTPSVVKYYTDSKVVLGYINNHTRRFYNYVSNRVDRILKVSKAVQWNFVPTKHNPADSSTRCCTTSFDSKVSTWLYSANWLCASSGNDQSESDSYPLVSPDSDSELRPRVDVLKTSIAVIKSLGTERFKNFSTWRSLVKAVSLLQHIAKRFSSGGDSCRKWHVCSKYQSVEFRQNAENFVLKEVQKECFSKEITCLIEGKELSRDSTLLSLSPYVDSFGLLRVGGRLNKIKDTLSTGEINPIILPKGHYISTLLIRHCHESVKHQGRYFTEGALRKSGYWVIGAKRAISSFINKCVTCRKLRGKFEHQKMADLLCDRLTPGPPFTSVGVDTFGPWHVVTRRTRGGVAQNKRWAILFTCLTTRAVHIELVEELSSSCFINALRRFSAIRGPVKIFRSDRGTNFIGAVDEINVNSMNVENGPLKNFLLESGSTWIFNPPHSSHMGGAWERMIGITRRILDSMLLNSTAKTLTHECLSTFMAEVCAIINSRPIAQISSDPESWMILSPSMLLTGKVEYLPVYSDSYGWKDMYRAQWKHVQILSDIFWKRWRDDYLHCLQTRRKWCSDRQSLKAGDVVLLSDKNTPRIDWPLGIVVDAIMSDDDKVRKARVRIHKDGNSVTYTRPITEMVLLIDKA